MDPRIDSVRAIHNRVGDIIQKVSTKMNRFEGGPRIPEAATSGGRAAEFLQRNSGAGAAGITPHTTPGRRSPSSSAPTAHLSGAQPEPGRRNYGFAAELETMIQQEAGNQAVSPDLIRAVIQAESGGRPDARSKAGALGLMQLMPATARELGVDPKNPRENIRGGVQYLNQMAGKFGDLDLALAAYNAGPGAVKKYGGVPPYRETIDYISKIRKSLGEPAR